MDCAGRPFVEPFARFSIAFAPGPIGLGALHPRGILSTYHVSDPTLACWLVEPGGWRAVQRQSLECLPWEVSEAGRQGQFTVQAVHTFAGPDTLFSTFTFTNTGSEAQVVEPAWTGVVQPETASYMLPYFEGAPSDLRKHICETGPQTISARLSAIGTGSALPEILWRVSAVAGQVTTWKSGTAPWLGASTAPSADGRIWYAMRGTPKTLLPGSQATWRFRLDVVTGNAQTCSRLPSAEVEDQDVVSARAQQRVLAALGAVPTDDLTLRARIALLRSGLEGCGALAGRRASLCTADSSDFSCVFFWDSLFSSVAISNWNPGFAQDAVRAVFIDQDPRDGSAGERHWDRSAPQRLITQSPQMPIAAWAVWEQVRHATDRSFARDMWPTLVANHRFWEEFSDVDRDGLAEIRWSGQFSDNSPLWDGTGMATTGTGCGWLPPIASVAVNAFLYRDAGHMAQLADLLALPGEPQRWRDRQTRLATALHQHCFVAGEGRFWDWNHHTRRHRRVKTFWMFWPLWAGMPVPEAVRDELLDRVLLDPQQFFGAVPFPSVAYDEQAYNPSGYWRGRAWPHVSTWLSELLWRHGRHDAADEAVRRSLACFTAHDGLRENLCTDPGHPKPGGFIDYNWGCAAVDLMSSGRWRELGP